MATLATKLKVWAAVFFDELWRLIPAQPVLFPFFFVSGLLTVLLAPPTFFGVSWVTLSLVSPVMVLAAWWLIVYKNGTARYLGMYVRTAGDVGQLVVLIADILLWGAVIPPPLVAIMLGLSTFVGVLVVRDILALWLVEQIASKLYVEVRKDVAAR